MRSATTPAWVVATVLALVLAGALGLVALNEVLLHGFSPACSLDPPAAGCGVTWRPGVPFLAGALLAVAVAGLTVRRARRAGRDPLLSR